MSRVEDLRENATVRGILPSGLVTVVSTKWYGSAALAQAQAVEQIADRLRRRP